MLLKKYTQENKGKSFALINQVSGQVFFRYAVSLRKTHDNDKKNFSWSLFQRVRGERYLIFQSYTNFAHQSIVINVKLFLKFLSLKAFYLIYIENELSLLISYWLLCVCFLYKLLWRSPLSCFLARVPHNHHNEILPSPSPHPPICLPSVNNKWAESKQVWTRSERHNGHLGDKGSRGGEVLRGTRV